MARLMVVCVAHLGDIGGLSGGHAVRKPRLASQVRERMKIVVALLLLCSAALAGPDRTRSVVAIRVRSSSTCVIDQYGRRSCSPGRIISTGSGVIVDNASGRINWKDQASGWAVLTAAHVVTGGNSCEVKLAGKWRYAYVHSNAGATGTDLALLVCEQQQGDDIEPVAIAETDPPGPEPIEALGHDEGLGDVVRPDPGDISGEPVDQDSYDGANVVKIRRVRKVRTRYSCTLGRSGGAVIDCESRLVGIISTRENADSRISYCVPVSDVRVFLKQRWRIPPEPVVEQPSSPEPAPAPTPEAAPQPTPADSRTSSRHPPALVMPLPYMYCPRPSVPGSPCLCMREISSLKARLASVEARGSIPGPAGPQGPPGPAGASGVDPETLSRLDALEAKAVNPDDLASIVAAVTANRDAIANLKESTGKITVVVEDNGKQVFQKSGVPTGAVIRVPIQRTETVNGR